MKWLAFGVAVIAVAGAVYVADREPGRGPRSQADDARMRLLQERIAALEEEVTRVHARMAARDARPAAPSPEPKGRSKKPGVASDETKREMRATWRQRILDARPGSHRVAQARDAHVQLKKHAGPDAARAFFEDLLREVDPASAVGLYAQMQLGHYARHEKEFGRAEEAYRRVEALARPGRKEQADAIFQLAWNRSQQDDPAGAEHEFVRAMAVPGIEPGTHAAALYAVSHIRREAGDAASAEQRLREIVELARGHPGDKYVRYYADRARKDLPQ